MPTTIKLRNSVTTTSAPSSLVQGEVAINITDKKVWVGNAATTPIQLLGDGGSGSFTSIAFGAGTVSNPSITFTGDTNTGIYSPAADTIAFTEGGVEAMRITAAGDVGIGGIPSFRLDVRAAQGIVSNTSTTGTNPVDYRVSNTGGNTYFGRDNSAGNAFGAGAYSTVIWSEGAYPMVLATNGSERMRIDSSGNVGIGTNSPSSYIFKNLVVATSGASTGISIVTSTTGEGTLAFGDGTAGTDSYRGYVQYKHSTDSMVFGVAGTVTAVNINSSGNVGIGFVPSPWSGFKGLQFGSIGSVVSNDFGSGNTQTGIFNNVYFDGLNYKYITTNVATYYNQGSGSHIWYIAPSGTAGTTATFTEAMRLNTNGNLVLQGGTITANGVGITFPATQSASTNANTLDDYEEGTWTPTDASGAGLTFTNPVGQYTKVGNVVFFSFNVTYPVTVNTNFAGISGFPFAASGTSALANPGSGFITYVNTGTAYTIPIGGGSTTGNFYNLGGGQITNAAISGSIIRYSGVIYT